MEFVKSSFVLSRAAKVFTYFSPLTVILVSAILGAMFVYNRRRSRLVKMIEKIPGPASMPIIGNSLHINVDHDGEFSMRGVFFTRIKKKFKKKTDTNM